MLIIGLYQYYMPCMEKLSRGKLSYLQDWNSSPEKIAESTKLLRTNEHACIDYIKTFTENFL